MIGLFFTLLLGLFILIGSLIVFITKNNDKFVHFSMSLALGVIISLIIIELLPESWELISENYNFPVSLIILIGFIILGVLILKTLDQFIHHHHHNDTKENLYHIGIVASIALILHNIIEGMAIYGAVTSDINMGLMISLGVGLHNIPMGMVVTSTFYKSTKNIRRTILFVSIIALSTFFGGLLMHINVDLLSNEVILGILLSLTNGMLIYISLFELLPHLFHGKDKINNILGVILGITIMVVSLFLE